ncbi:TPA: hemolysin [Patescibacteria group bacterium]|nr:hemolysin [Candidatus Gracilibacteria bacterium]
MEKIIDPVEVKLLEQELNTDTFLRPVNRGANELYIIHKEDCPHVMQEIGRLREITFRGAGGGTGKSSDIDEYDDYFHQLVLWNPDRKEIVGGYRFACMSKLVDNNTINSPTHEIFQFSDTFIKDYLPRTIELGRSFVQPEYQPIRNPKAGLFSLDNLWDGLGALVVDYPNITHFFGKVTMYPSFNSQARNYILFFLQKYCPDTEHLMLPVYPIQGLDKEIDLLAKFLDYGSYDDDLKHLMDAVAALGTTIPPLVKQYMNLSPTLKTFGTSISPSFGDVEETGMLITIADIHSRKKDQHVETYRKYKLHKK